MKKLILGELRRFSNLNVLHKGLLMQDWVDWDQGIFFLIWSYEACNNKDKLVIENSVSGRSVLGQSCFRLKYIWAEVSMGPKYYWGWSILWAEVCHICLGPMWVRGLSGLWAKLGMSLLSDFLTEIYLFITPQVLLYFRGRSVTTLPNASTQ